MKVKRHNIGTDVSQYLKKALKSWGGFHEAGLNIDFCKFFSRNFKEFLKNFHWLGKKPIVENINFVKGKLKKLLKRIQFNPSIFSFVIFLARTQM